VGTLLLGVAQWVEVSRSNDWAESAPEAFSVGQDVFFENVKPIFTTLCRDAPWARPTPRGPVSSQP
jgi:hypothetical protein